MHRKKDKLRDKTVDLRREYLDAESSDEDHDQYESNIFLFIQVYIYIKIFLK